MSLSANLWTLTGVIHCCVGLAVPELRVPLVRVLTTYSTDPGNGDMVDRYERECAFWFQMGGLFMIMEGMIWKSYVNATGCQELPTWFGVTLTVVGLLGLPMMPASGFWLILAQGIRIIWNQHQLSKSSQSGGKKRY